MRSSILILAVLLAGCGTDAVSGPSASPGTAVAPPPSLAVPAQPLIAVVDRQSANATYHLHLMNEEGRVVAKTEAVMPSGNHSTGCSDFAPLVATSATRAYFINGANLDYLDPDGTARTLRPLALHYPGSVAGIAVSSDDGRLAVGEIAHQGGGAEVRVDAGSLTGFLQPVLNKQVNSADTQRPDSAQWPLGYAGRDLVLGQGPVLAQACSAYPVSVTVQRPDGVLAPVCAGELLAYQAPPAKGGLLCRQSAADGTETIASWSGAVAAFPTDKNCPDAGVVSPDGSEIAGAKGQMTAGACGVAGDHIWIFDRHDVGRQTNATGMVVAWIDTAHLLISGDGSGGALKILDLSSDTVTVLPVSGTYAGLIPGGF